ncbi:MAG: T9SS type A sorting domain-containing protein [candidate division WOR-3 bacterium]|nr:MAG: T9SS type A sorting domain-containing protein [candidate division WOR-3 bacterium]
MRLIIVFSTLFFVPFLTTAATVQVDMVGLDFVPDTININLGDTVTWVNASGIIHTSTSGLNGIPDGYWDSGNIPAGDSFSFVFDSVGVFPYYCTPHWTLGMIGAVIVGQTGIGEFDSPVNPGVSISQNYPNPFSSITTIRFEIASPTQTELTVFDITGKRVKTFSTGFRDEGLHTVSWDGRNDNGDLATNGVYVYELVAGDDVMRKKLIIAR